jgi:hypothetical protein
VLAQSRREKYDSLLVGDRITPAVSSVMMPKSYTEVIIYSSLITANKGFETDGDPVPLFYRGRDAFLFNTLQVTHGLSRSGRFNLGMDLSYRIGRTDVDPQSSPTKVFGNNNEGLIDYDRAFTSVGLRARYIPFAKVPNLIVQHTFTIPIGKGSDESQFLGEGRYAVNSQILYNQLLGRKMFLFAQTGLYVRLKESNDYNTDYTVPVNIFATYLLSKHVFPFVQLGMSKTWFEYFKSTSYTYGVGMQYQITSMHTINFFYNDTFAGKFTNRWKTFNLGLRAVF